MWALILPLVKTSGFMFPLIALFHLPDWKVAHHQDGNFHIKILWGSRNNPKSKQGNIIPNNKKELCGVTFPVYFSCKSKFSFF